MPNPLSLHTWTLDTTPLARVLDIVKTTGWDAIELRRLDFKRAADAGQPAEAVLDLVRRSALGVSCVGVELGWLWAEGAERARLLAAFDESCRWAKDLGSRTVMSPVDRGEGPVARAADSVKEVGDIAGRHGVRLALEFNSQCAQINTLRSVREVLARAAHPQVGLLLDTYHLQRSGAKPDDLADVAPAEIAYVQFSDVPRSGLVPGQALDRLPPGQGSVPFAAWFATFAGKGYSGYCSYEAPNPAAWARDPTVVSREALQATRAVAGGSVA
ncbi:MAG TPA: sugar phosphate isomerase/epimerase [Methylomirabilota bacterium]|nr:sugar phosphate isomerase/epimerase [Methylomirabilota bacterium]